MNPYISYMYVGVYLSPNHMVMPINWHITRTDSRVRNRYYSTTDQDYRGSSIEFPVKINSVRTISSGIR